MRRRAHGAILGVALSLAPGCGQSFTTAPGTDGGDGASSAGATDGPGPEAGKDAPPDVVSSGETGMGDVVSIDAPGCPVEQGSYAISKKGQGCGTLSEAANQCVSQMGCMIQFGSVAAGSPGLGLNSTPLPIGRDGGFDKATIVEGTNPMPRTDCTGVWFGKSSTLVVDCGGLGSSQSCVVTLTRTSMTCGSIAPG